MKENVMTPKTMESIIELCTPKLSEEDVLKLDAMLAKLVPPKAMAADAAIKRRQMLALDSRARGPVAHGMRGAALSVTEKLALDSRARRAGKQPERSPAAQETFEKMFPNSGRLN